MGSIRKRDDNGQLFFDFRSHLSGSFLNHLMET
jgi:hypothetical protein